METRATGDPALALSAITLGCMARSGAAQGDVARVRTMRTAIDAGITSLDTAPLYEFGRSEELVGQAIRGRRAEVQLMTKVGLRWDDDHGEVLFECAAPGGRRRTVRKDSRPESLRYEVESSLRRLGVDQLDLVQVHHLDPRVPVAETMGALAQLRSEGKLRAIGVSNYPAKSVRAASEALGDVPLASHQLEYNLLSRGAEVELLPVGRALGVAGLAYAPLVRGLLAGRLRSGVLEPGDRRRAYASFQPENAARIDAVLTSVVAPIAETHGATLAQIALAWLLAQPGVASVVVGAGAEVQARDNARAADVRLTPVEVAQLGDRFAGLRLERPSGRTSGWRLWRRTRSLLGRIGRGLPARAR